MTSILEGTQPPQNKAFSNKKQGAPFGFQVYITWTCSNHQMVPPSPQKDHLEKVLPIHENKFLYVLRSKVAILGMGDLPPLMTESL